MTDDAELLRQYAQSGSDTAFAERGRRENVMFFSWRCPGYRGKDLGDCFTLFLGDRTSATRSLSLGIGASQSLLPVGANPGEEPPPVVVSGGFSAFSASYPQRLCSSVGLGTAVVRANSWQTS